MCSVLEGKQYQKRTEEIFQVYHRELLYHISLIPGVACILLGVGRILQNLQCFSVWCAEGIAGDGEREVEKTPF